MKRIVVADDDAEMRRLLVAVLRNAGHVVDEASDGNELRRALEARSEPIDLLVTDVQMPGWTGLDVLEWAKRTMPAVDVVLITAFGDRELHARAAQLGASAVLDKPFDLFVLQQVVAETTARVPD